MFIFWWRLPTPKLIDLDWIALQRSLCIIGLITCLLILVLTSIHLAYRWDPLYTGMLRDIWQSSDVKQRVTNKRGGAGINHGGAPSHWCSRDYYRPTLTVKYASVIAYLKEKYKKHQSKVIATKPWDRMSHDVCATWLWCQNAKSIS